MYIFLFSYVLFVCFYVSAMPLPIGKNLKGVAAGVVVGIGIVIGISITIIVYIIKKKD